MGVQVCMVCECCPGPSPSQGGLAAGALVGGNSLWVDALCSQNLSLHAAGQKVFLVTLGSAAVLRFPWTGLGLKLPGLSQGARIQHGERSACTCAMSVKVLSYKT